MKNAILRATLLGIVASASFSLTQAASLAATSPAQMTSTTACALAPAKAAHSDAVPSTLLPQPTGHDPFGLLGGN
ncbi:MAG: hypothetical protein ACLPSH_19275 [Vulcanimicrobiaceae bacterium]|jgi:hypothetical protein